MIVAKFGGTSVADAAAIRRLVAIAEGLRARAGDEGSLAGPVLVVSALAGVTDRLLEIARLAEIGDADAATKAVEALHARHLEVAEMIGDSRSRAALVGQIDLEFSILGDIVVALAVIREVTPRSLDAVAACGELLSSRIVAAALADAGLPSVWIDARRALATDASHTNAAPLMAETAARLEAEVRPHLTAGRVPVMGGFVGSTLDGATTTLGRGGSDYSASIVGASLGASEIQIWTDVDGMLTADPRIVSGPRLVRQLSFAEASELAYFGAKVLHPATILPAVARSIPVRILNSKRPDVAGTLITDAAPARECPVTAIAAKRDLTVIEITSSRMLMAHGFLHRLFEVFDRFGTAVDVVTTSEVSVSITVDDRRRLPDLLHALAEFAEVSVEHDMALVCVVGEHLRTEPTMFVEVVHAIGDLSLRMVSQAASRRNITFVLRQADLTTAMTRLHDRFFGQQAPADAAAVSAPA